MTDQEKKKAKRQYTRDKKIFLAEHRFCAVFSEYFSTQVHHSRGRLGALLLDKRFWIPTSAWGHDWIHRNIESARQRKWKGRPLMCEKGGWNRFPNE